MPKRKPCAIDLFAGAGGLTEGLRQAGFRVAGAIELDRHACASYRLNHPSVHLWETDITDVTGTELLRRLRLRRGQLDLLAACPPCQGFSTMRTRNGAVRNRDSRNALIADVLRLVRSMRPKAVMLENVPGLYSDRRYRAFRRGLKQAGYVIREAVLDTADFGVPQRRKRLVVLASRVTMPEFGRKSIRARTVREWIGELKVPAKSRDPLHNYEVNHVASVRELIRLIPRNGGSRTILGARSLACHRRTDGFYDVYGRMSWDKPAPTITSGCINPSKGRFLHPDQNRAITLREAALLQTFPRSYKFDMAPGRYAVALLIGNALPPEFIRRHALALKSAICRRQGLGR
jgi:DNA (cytosine-5)-methyltransferase 1